MRRVVARRTVAFAAVLAALGVTVAVPAVRGQLSTDQKATTAELVVAKVALFEGATELATFRELRELVMEAEVAEVLDSGRTGPESGLVTKPKPPRATLTRALTFGLGLGEWIDAVRLGSTTARKNVSLVLYDGLGKQLTKFELQGAFPIKLDYQSSSGSITETVTLTAANIQRVSPGK